MTIERARRFARAYLDEFGPNGVFEMSMPSELEIEMVAAVLVKELDCTVEWMPAARSIRVTLPWMKFVDKSFMLQPTTTDKGVSYVS